MAILPQYNKKFTIMPQVNGQVQEQTLSFAAIITRKASKELTKKTENGDAVYVLHQALITEGPLAGKTVTAQRTLWNSEGIEKPGVELNQEVQLYVRVVENENGERKPFFDIGANNTASDEEILGLLGYDTDEDDADLI